MANLRQPSEIDQRLQVYTHINNLKTKCEHLFKVKNDLSTKLSELNEVVDLLIAEKNANEYDPNLKIDLPLQHKKSLNLHLEQPPTDPESNYNLANNYDTGRHQQPAVGGERFPSSAFKIKLSDCLNEISPMATEISALSEHIYESNSQK